MGTFFVTVLFIIILGFLLTALKYLGQEKHLSQSYYNHFNFSSLIISVPPWWQKTGDPIGRLGFRSLIGTREFICEFQLQKIVPSREFQTNFPFMLGDFLDSHHIVMDPDSVLENRKEIIISDQKLNQRIQSIYRLEGKGTLKKEKRIYLDCFLIKYTDLPTPLLCYAISPVLMGGLEGPYFEKAVFHMAVAE